MRLALLADTHGFLDPRIADLVSACDMAVHAGDIGGADVLLSLQPREQVIAIRGNNDVPQKWPEHERHVLENLPRETRVPLAGGDLVVVHGDESIPVAARHDAFRRRYPDAKAVVYGHTHSQTVDQSATPWVLNPGAAGRTRTYGGPACLILDCHEQGWSVETVQFPVRRYPSLRSGPRRGESGQSAASGE
ncbi:metallophosphoesterase family protein [Ectothiorhodospiraceae bacterium WFHF3C12]|nr:metallophosphoesterase family protein [Ectothiorhodospiraceae bacterium WFHF3C12]